MVQIAAEKIQNGLPIAAVERETGISKDTLRVWEKRYGFPQPLRDAFNERIYPNAQIQRLKLIQRLVKAGYRPRKIANLHESALQELLEKKHLQARAELPYTDNIDSDIDVLLVAIKNHDEKTLRHILQQRLTRYGLRAFIIELIAPLITAVGHAWETGQVEVFEEHFFTHIISNYLRDCINTIPPCSVTAGPKVLLTTIPQELHGLGLLMVEALLTLDGCQCVSLGTQTPLNDIVYATRTFQTDVVALSFTNQHAAPVVQTCLQTLRSELDPRIEIWTGGACTALYKQSMDNICAMNNLSGLQSLILGWQQRHEPATPLA